MSNSIKYIEKENYLIREFHGIFYLPEILESWEYLIKNYLQEHQFLGVVNDFSSAQLKMKLDDLNDVIKLFQSNYEIFKDLKLAVIMTSPENMVFPVFAKEKSPFKIKALTTLGSAINWLLDK